MKRNKATFECERINCFACFNGFCQILTEPTKRTPCPFFKTRKEYAVDRAAAAAINEEHEEAFRRAMMIMAEPKPEKGDSRHDANRPINEE